LGMYGPRGSTGISFKAKSEASAAASARAFGVPKKSSNELLVGPRRRALPRTISRLRNVAWRLRVTPVSRVMSLVRTPCEIRRRTMADRRLSREIGSSLLDQFMESPTEFGVVTREFARNFPPQCCALSGQSLPVFTERDVSMYKRKGKGRRATVSPTIWSALPLLEAARRLNQRCFALLQMTALARTDADSPVFARRDLWARIDERGIDRAGRCPVLLLSLQLHNLEWWQRAIEGGVGPVLLNAPPPLFDAAEVAPLLRAILAEAWSAAHVNVFAASLFFGMTPAVAKTLVSLTAQTIDRIVTTQASAVRPRWEESRTFWNGLLEVAVAEDNEALTHVHLHALQLLGSEAHHRHA
jgi:hypothetical protein